MLQMKKMFSKIDAVKRDEEDEDGVEKSKLINGYRCRVCIYLFYYYILTHIM